ncbi:MAG: hypothetical protein AB8F78_14535 [Saprospiraceae bacterium]
MAKSLRKADLDTVVVQTGRQLEGAARELVPERTNQDGKPLMLGERMFRLKDHFEEDTWQAYQAWAGQRNKYIHNEIDSIPDKDEFIDNFEVVLDELEALASVEEESEPEPVWMYVLLALVLAGLVFYAC